jgi:hypothetical protein
MFIFTSDLKPLLSNFAKYEADFDVLIHSLNQRSMDLEDDDMFLLAEEAHYLPPTSFCHVCQAAYSEYLPHLTSGQHLQAFQS